MIVAQDVICNAFSGELTGSLTASKTTSTDVPMVSSAGGQSTTWLSSLATRSYDISAEN